MRMTFSLGSFFSTSVLISSKPQIRLFGTWFSAEYHRIVPTLLLWCFGRNEGTGRSIAEPTAVLAAATVTGAAAVIRDVMRRSASR